MSGFFHRAARFLAAAATFSTGVSALAVPGDAAGAPPPIAVVATIPALAEWTARVGGRHVTVETLLPPGASPHVFEPSASGMRRVSQARLFVCVGLRMDDWAARLAKAAGRGAAVLPLGDALAARGGLARTDAALSGTQVLGGGHPAGDGHDHGHDHGDGPNPHFWLDPTMAAACLDDLTTALTALSPSHGAEFTSNAAAYRLELAALDVELAATLAPVRGQSFVAFHDAYPYLAARYGLKVAAVIEESPGKVPSDRYVREVSNKLRVLKITTVFTEPQLNPRVAEILAAAVGAKTAMLDPYGTPGSADRGDYAATLRYNAARLREAMNGK